MSQKYQRNNLGFLPNALFRPVNLLDAFRDAHPRQSRAQYGLSKEQIEAVRSKRAEKLLARSFNNHRSRTLNPAWK